MESRSRIVTAGSSGGSRSTGTPDGVPITVVDWQTVTHGPALTDVAYFIGAGLVCIITNPVG